MIQTIGLADDLAEKIADLVLKQAGEDPFQTAQIQIILPTRRACLAVKNAFLQRAATRSLLLPQLIPLYELNALNPDIPEAMPALERTLLLAKLCLPKPNITTPDQAFKVALSLGELLDTFYQFETDTTHLADLVDNPIFAEHWNETVVFLDIITKAWPLILKEHGVIDEADRRIRLINAYTHSLAHNPQFVIAAGLDGGLPAVRRLIHTIDAMPNGIILTEGIDTTLSDEAFKALPNTHYQESLKQILRALNKTPAQVDRLTPQTPREKLIQVAFKPETRTDEWRHEHIDPTACTGVMRLDTETPVEEALTIALMLRGALETPGKTAALVTSDRNLARRVITEMKRWGITLDDSAGTPLFHTPVGIFLNLITTVATTQGKNSEMLALLKHPLTADGQNPMALRQRVKAAEKEARKHKTDFQFPLNTDMQAFGALFQNNVLVPLKTILAEHIRVAEQLATSSDRTGAERLWSDDAGQCAFTLLSDLMAKGDTLGTIEPIFYPEILNILMQAQNVRPSYGMHPRLDILGPIEARFHHPDLCIIGGLNEGVFPPMPDCGPWLNRAMRDKLSLPPVESKTASLAMDFAHCFCSPEVILTRAKKADGTETIPSRFLARLEAALQGSRLSLPIQVNHWARALEQPETPDKVSRPMPCPPVDARPNTMAVTKVELWMRNPYAIYARYILRLFPLDPLISDKKQQLYGSAVHRILEQFIRKNPKNADQAYLMHLANDIFDETGLTASDKAFCLPRFEQVAAFVLEQQDLMKNQIKESWPEEKGQWTFDVAGKPFTLTGTADRIDVLCDNSVRILDYKTGSPPSIKSVITGHAPQLPLEALILKNGGFPHIKTRNIQGLDYWKLAAQKENCKAIRVLKDTKELTAKKQAEEMAEQALTGITELVTTYRRQETPFSPGIISGQDKKYDDYAHLARTAEWQHDCDEDPDD